MDTRATSLTDASLSAAPRALRAMRLAAWAVLLALAAAQAWIGRAALSPDAVSYLDLGDAWWRGDWPGALNAYWSPGYSILLGAAMRIFRPSPDGQYPVVHLVNFAIFVAALAAFEMMLRELLVRRREKIAAGAARAIPEAVFALIAYAAFASASFSMVGLAMATPDLLVTACFYGSAALMLRQIRRPSAAWAAILGATLAVGYLVKAPLFPVAFVFLAVALFAWGGPRRAFGRVAVALAAFALVAGPFVVALSLQQGRPTFGESARLNFFWFNSAKLDPAAWHWQLQPENRSLAKHPMTAVVEKPEIVRFSGPERATYAPWCDPARWHEGASASIEPSRIAASAFRQIRTYAHILLLDFPTTALLAGLLFLVLLGPGCPARIAQACSLWPVLVPALAALVMFVPVHVEPRHVAGFFAVFWAAAFAGATIPESPRRAQAAVGLAVAAAAALVLSAVFGGVIPPRAPAGGHAFFQPQGLVAGDRVAVIGNGFTASMWARPIGVRIVEQGTWKAFCDATPEQRAKAVEAVRASGVRAIVFDGPVGFDEPWVTRSAAKTGILLFPDPSHSP